MLFKLVDKFFFKFLVRKEWKDNNVKRKDRLWLVSFLFNYCKWYVKSCVGENVGVGEILKIKFWICSILLKRNI